MFTLIRQMKKRQIKLFFEIQWQIQQQMLPVLIYLIEFVKMLLEK